MRLTVLGGGGFRVPRLARALAGDTAPQRVTDLRLHDTDERRLAAIRAVLADVDGPGMPEVTATTVLAEALSGTDVVLCLVRAGGTAGRALDERIARAHGVIGHDTVGAGGIAAALRGIPVALEIADAVLAHAPAAWFLNASHPAGILTEVLRNRLGERVVGVCATPAGLARRILTVLHDAGIVEDGGLTDGPGSGPTRGEVHADYVGLNHLGWLRGLTVDGRDLLPELLERPDLIESVEEGRLFGADWIRALGCVPNVYLYPFYFTREALAAEREAGDTTPGAARHTEQSAFFEAMAGRAAGDLVAGEALAAWKDAAPRPWLGRPDRGGPERGRPDRNGPDPGVAGRGVTGCEDITLALVHALGNGPAAEFVLDIPNAGRLREFDYDAVIEAPCRVDASGINPLPGWQVPDHGKGLMKLIKYVERRTVAAAVSADRDEALLALAHHPLVDSVQVARALLDDYVAAFDELAYLR